MLKKLLLVLVGLSWGSYSYSDSITPYYGYTGNAAVDALTWQMTNVFPDPPGLEVNGVLYNYTINKDVNDLVIVNVQNENALGTGYIFRETDEWRPGSLGGTQINKVIGLPNIPKELWGDGSIEVNGPGYVTDANVVYTYRVDPCYDPQFDPNCPGYKPPLHLVPKVDYDIYDATNGDADQTQYNPDDELYDEEEEKSEEELKAEAEEEERDRKERLENALAAAENALMFANALAVSQMLDSMNNAMNMNTYYTTSIPGGEYKETVNLVDKELPDSRSGLRNNFAQQLLHDKMVEMQYQEKN
jgi:hypothetical protein